MAEEIVDTGASPEPHQLQSESTLMMAPLHAPDRVGEEPLDADREMTAIMPPGSVYPGPEDSSGAATVMMSSPVLAMDPASMAEATPLADPAPFLPLEVRETEAEEPTIAIPPEPFRAPRTPVETARPEPVATVMMPPISFGAAPPAADDGERATHSPALFGEAASAPSRAPAPEDEATLAALSPERSGGTSSPASPARAALPGEDEPTMGALPTPTLAEIYLAQGMPGKALEIYKQVLEGDPQNPEALARVRELSERLQPSGGLTQRKIQVLEGWLERIRRHGHVQDDAGRGGPTSAGV
jgi:hypothetical protein